MLRTCETCGQRYDDEVRWTICPHNRLEASYDAPRGTSVGYCEEHDLYACPMEHGIVLPKRPPNRWVDSDGADCGPVIEGEGPPRPSHLEVAFVWIGAFAFIGACALFGFSLAWGR